MNWFSDCSGECCVCACGEGCLAGHGDDDFSPASKEKIIDNLDNGYYPETEYIIQYLFNQCGYRYDRQNCGSKEEG